MIYNKKVNFWPYAATKIFDEVMVKAIEPSCSHRVLPRFRREASLGPFAYKMRTDLVHQCEESRN